MACVRAYCWPYFKPEKFFEPGFGLDERALHVGRSVDLL